MTSHEISYCALLSFGHLAGNFKTRCNLKAILFGMLRVAGSLLSAHVLLFHFVFAFKVPGSLTSLIIIGKSTGCLRSLMVVGAAKIVRSGITPERLSRNHSSFMEFMASCMTGSSFGQGLKLECLVQYRQSFP